MIIISSNVKYDCPILNFQLCKLITPFVRTNKSVIVQKITLNTKIDCFCYIWLGSIILRLEYSLQ